MSNANQRRPKFLGFLFGGPKAEVVEVEEEVAEVADVEEGEMNEAPVESEPAPSPENLHNDLNFGLDSPNAEPQPEPNNEIQPEPNRSKRNLLSIIFSPRRNLRTKASVQDLSDVTMAASHTDSLSAPTVLDLEVESEPEKAEEETPAETFEDEEEDHEGGFFHWLGGLLNGGRDDDEDETEEEQQEAAEEETPEAPASTLTEPLLPPETHDVENPAEEEPVAAPTSEHPKSSKLCICLNISLCLLMLAVVILVGYYTWTGHCANIKSCLSTDATQFSSDFKQVSSSVASGAQTGWGYVESRSVTAYKVVSSGVVTASGAIASGTVHCYGVVSSTVKGWFS